MTHIKIGMVHVSPLKDTIREITVGEIAETKIGTLEVDVAKVKV